MFVVYRQKSWVVLHILMRYLCRLIYGEFVDERSRCAHVSYILLLFFFILVIYCTYDIIFVYQY